jgi:hypothetical protein
MEEEEEEVLLILFEIESTPIESKQQQLHSTD